MNKQINDEIFKGYEKLASAIIQYSIKEFKFNADKYKKGNNQEERLKTMKSIMKFVRSDYWSSITDLNAKIIEKHLLDYCGLKI